MTLPTGTITFLFTDIEGSTRLWEEHPDAMRLALARHDSLLRAAIETHGGTVFKTMGDAFCAAFASPTDALDAALEAQRALVAERDGVMERVPAEWAASNGVMDSGTTHYSVPLKVRMAAHTGVSDLRDGDYFGPPLNRLARLLAVGHGRQVLL